MDYNAHSVVVEHGKKWNCIFLACFARAGATATGEEQKERQVEARAASKSCCNTTEYEVHEEYINSHFRAHSSSARLQNPSAAATATQKVDTFYIFYDAKKDEWMVSPIFHCVIIGFKRCLAGCPGTQIAVPYVCVSSNPWKVSVWVRSALLELYEMIPITKFYNSLLLHFKPDDKSLVCRLLFIRPKWHHHLLKGESAALTLISKALHLLKRPPSYNREAQCFSTFFEDFAKKLRADWDEIQFVPNNWMVVLKQIETLHC